MSHEFAGAELTLGQANALVKILGGMEVVMRLLQGTAKAVIETVKLLTALTTVSVPGVKKFVVKDQLKEANVGYTGSNFDNFFLGKAEENVDGITMKVHRLEKDSLDSEILAELGGEDKAPIRLSHFFDLLKKQSKGQDGPLLTNGYANIAYIRDEGGKLWAVRAYWCSCSRYWGVHARSVEHPHVWFSGDRVLSCDC